MGRRTLVIGNQIKYFSNKWDENEEIYRKLELKIRGKHSLVNSSFSTHFQPNDYVKIGLISTISQKYRTKDFSSLRSIKRRITAPQSINIINVNKEKKLST